jgi:DNA-binding LacI/PurR family transcriptional regulator
VKGFHKNQPAPYMSVTIYEVAKKAGVGIGTVSRVLNNSPKISPQTRARVLKAIKQLNYQPHAMAQGLARKKTHTIAILIPFFTGYFYVELLKGIQQAVSQHKYDLILYCIDDVNKRDTYLKRAFQQRRVDGVLLISSSLPDHYAKEFRSRRLPLVLVDAFHPEFDSITVNDQDGACSAVRHLIAFGHQRIAMITGHLECPPSQHRLDGCQRALAEAGLTLPASMLVSSDGMAGEAAAINDGFNKEAGYQGMKHFLERNGGTNGASQRPTAVFVACDIQAIGAMKAIRECGLRIPEDIALVGFDDIELAEYVGLTTVRQPMFQMGKQGVERLMALMDDPQLPRQHVRIETALVVRESCGAKKTDKGKTI